MRWAHAFIPTLREDPAEAEAASHRLLVRGGYIRQLMAGSYSLLPPMMRVRAKVMAIVREEMNAIGGQEFRLPALHPSELWHKTGRWDVMGAEMFRLFDRKDAELCLGMTHEEVFTTLALELSSYRDLPQLWYQIETKFRDEPRPKSGLLRVREFTMKDSYSFDVDEAGLDVQFQAHREAYPRIFRRCALEAIMVKASSGAMGGEDSAEFMVRSEAGEDEIVTCGCGYAANLETATSRVDPVEDPAPAELERFPTPGIRTIAQLAAFDAGSPSDRQIKTLVYLIDGEATLVLLRGDHDLVEQKLVDGLGAIDLRPATGDEIVDLLGASAGSLGAVGVAGPRIVADPALRARSGLTTGANVDDYHLRNVSVDRDIDVDLWLDVRKVRAGEPCVACGDPVEVSRAIELGHIFKLGTRYSAQLGAAVLDADGVARDLVMGCYGIGIERTIAAIVETYHDDRGIVWPMSVAPFQVVVTAVRADDAATKEASTSIYEALTGRGFEVLLDDRLERPGVKFADAELVGIPIRITVGPRGLADGVVEVTVRSDPGRSENVSLEGVVDDVAARISSLLG